MHSVSAQPRLLPVAGHTPLAFDRIVEEVPLGIAVIDRDGRTVAVNSAMCSFVGRGRDELLAGDLRALIDGEHGHMAQALARLSRGEIARFEGAVRHTRAGAEIAWGALTIVPESGDETSRFVVMVEDVTARHEVEHNLRGQIAKLSELALQDPLTGLANYAYFHSELDRELLRSQRYGRSFAIVLLDIDDFGKVNARSGYAVGDRLLRRTGQALSEACRGSDLPARTGGDEFGLLLPHTDREGAAVAASRVRKTLGRMDPAVAVSLGVAYWPSAGESKDLLLAAADVALHASKPGRRAPAHVAG